MAKRTKAKMNEGMGLEAMRAASANTLVFYSFLVESTGYLYGPFATADKAAEWIINNHCWSATITVVRSFEP